MYCARRLSRLAALFATAGLLIAATVGRAAPAALPPHVIARFCGNASTTTAQSEGTLVESWRGGPAASSTPVLLRCAPVERVANRPVRRRYHCTQAAAGWQCEPDGKDMSLPVNGRDTVVQFPAEFNTWSALQMAQAMGRIAVPVADNAGSKARCQLGGDNSDPVTARLTIDCDLWSVVFVKLCQGAQCRYEPVSRMGRSTRYNSRRRS